MSNRKERYGKLVRGWDWRTTPDLLHRADIARKRQRMTKTEFIEYALNLAIKKEETHDPTNPIP